MRHLKHRLTSAALLLVLFSGCSSTAEGPSANTTSSPNTPTASPDASRSFSVVEISKSPSASPSSSAAVPVEGAYPGAGGPRPSESRPITTFDGDAALIVSPSGNIKCAFSGSYGGCGITSYLTDQPYGSDELGPLWWLDLDAGPAELISPPETPITELSAVPPQEVPYGEVVHHGNYVCASESHGLTCWNTRTGHGAVMSRAGTRTF